MKEKNSFSGQIGFVLQQPEVQSVWEISGDFHISVRKDGEDFS